MHVGVSPFNCQERRRHRMVTELPGEASSSQSGAEADVVNTANKPARRRPSFPYPKIFCRPSRCRMAQPSSPATASASSIHHPPRISISISSCYCPSPPSPCPLQIQTTIRPAAYLLPLRVAATASPTASSTRSLGRGRRGRLPPPSALPDPQSAALLLLVAAGTVGAASLLLRSSSSSSTSEQQRQEEQEQVEGEECPDCGGTGLCGRCKGEGFVFKQLSDETATKARKAAKNMATRYTAGLPTKWTYCNKCSSTRSCTTCRGSGRIVTTPVT